MSTRIQTKDCYANLNKLTLKGASASDIENCGLSPTVVCYQYKLTDEIKDWLRSVRVIYSSCGYPFDRRTNFKMFENPAFGKKEVTEEDFFFILQTIAKKIKSKYMKTPYKGEEFGHDFGDYYVEIIDMHSGVFSGDGYIYIEIGS